MTVTLASLLVEVDTRPVASGVKDLDRLTDAGGRAEAATQKLSASNKTFGQSASGAQSSLRDMAEAVNATANAEMAAVRAAQQLVNENRALAASVTSAGNDARKAAAGFDTFYDAAQNDFATQYVRQAGAVNAAHVATGKGAKLAAHELANLGSQFADIGVSLASGQALYMVAIQQGAQIGGIMGNAASRGVTLSAALRGVAGAAAPLAIALAPIAVLGGAAAAAFGLLNRELSKGYPEDVTEGLGLTEEQLKRVEDRTVSLGDTWKSTLDVMAKYLTSGPLGAAIDWLGETWNTTLDFITAVAFEGTAVVVGSFIGAYRGIIGTWSAFPAAFGDILATGFNGAILGIEGLLNAARTGLNTLITAASAITGAVIPKIPEADLSQFKMTVTGAAEFIPKAFGASIAQSIQDTRAGMRQIGKEIGLGAVANAQGRVRDQAGDANKAAKSATSDAEREYDRLLKSSERFLAQLEKETAEIGKTAIQIKAMAIEAAAAVAPTKALADAIRTQGDMLLGLMAGKKAIDDINQSMTTFWEAVGNPDFEEGPLQDLITDLSLIDGLARDAAAGMEQSFGRLGGAFGGILKSVSGYRLEMARLRQDQKDGYIDEAQRIRSEQALRVGSYGDMVSSAKGFFKEGSSGYKTLAAAEKAYRLVEFAMSVRSILLKGAETAATVTGAVAEVGAVTAAEAAKTAATAAGTAVRTPLKAAEGAASIFAALGPFGFPVVAAMAAVLIGMGAKGLKGGSGAAPGATDMEDRQKAQGAGSVLGSSTAKSESIAKSLEIMASNTNKDLEYSNSMLKALRSIDSQIGAVAAALAQTLSAGGALDTGKLNLGQTGSTPTLKNLGFSSSTTRTLQDQGISLGGGSISDILSGGLTGNTYQQVLEKTKKTIFGITTSNKSKSTTTTGALDQGFLDQTTALIDSLRNAVLEGAKVLGVEGAQALVDQFQVNLGNLSFKDMDGAQIQEALNAIFGKLGDDLAATAIPSLTELQKVGEGAFETLSRVVRGYQVVDVSLSSIGKEFGAVGVASLAARERLIDLSGGIDAFAEQTSFFAETFLTEAERLAPIQTAVAKEFKRLGLAGIDTRDEFKQLVLGLDVSTAAGAEMYAALMALAPAFAKITEESKTVSEARDKLSTAYERESSALQSTIDKFKGFSDSLKKFRDSLYSGPAAMLSPEEQYKATRAAFERTSALARGGDQNAIADLQGVSQAYLDASKDYYASSREYFADLEAVRSAVSATESYASSQVSAAEQQLAALDKSVEGLLTVNESVLSVRDAVAALQGAISAAAPPVAPTPTAANQNSPAPFVAATTQVVAVADPETTKAIENLTETVGKLTQAQIDQQAAIADQRAQQAAQQQSDEATTHRYLRKTQAF